MLTIISTPFGYLMNWLYQWTQNYAIALLIFALVVKLVLMPFTINQRTSAVKQARLRPKEMAIKKRYAGRTDTEARIQMATELQAMYKEEHYSVAGGCLPLLIQFPIIIALYDIVRAPLTYISRLSSEVISNIQTKALELVKNGVEISGATAESTALTEIQLNSALNTYPNTFAEFIPEGTLITNFNLFGINISEFPSFAFTLLIIFPFLAGAFQWLSSFIMSKLMPKPAMTADGEKTPEAIAAERTMRNMNIIMPAITVFIAFSLPAVMSLYWVYQSVIGTVVTVIVYKLMPLPTFTEEEYRLVEEEMNKDYVPIPVSRGGSSGRSLHRIDEEDEIDGEVIEVTDYTVADDGETDGDSESVAHREESAPRIRYDKNGNPIRSLHYIDFDEEEAEGPKVKSDEASANDEETE